MGSWSLDEQEAHSWASAAKACLTRCASCEGCRHISIGLRFHDCSWYAACASLNTKVEGFRSGAVELLAAPAKPPKDLGWALAEDASRAAARLRLVRYSRALARTLEQAHPARAPPHPGGGRGLLLLVGVMTPPGAARARADMRTMLAAAVAAHSRFAYRFAVGRAVDASPEGGNEPLSAEQHAFGDLARLRCADGSKELLALKNMQWFAWAQQHYRGTDFVAKADLDTFVVVPRVLAVLKLVKRRLAVAAAAADGAGALPPALLGSINWASFDVRRGAVCGCCAFTLDMAWHIRASSSMPCSGQPGTALSLARLGEELLRDSPVEPPHPYAAGPFYAVSSGLQQWLADSGELRSAIRAHAARNASRFTLYADEINMGKLAGRAPHLRAFNLGIHGNAVASVHEERITMGAECAHRLAFRGESNVTTGYFFPHFGYPERIWPSAVAVHKVFPGEARFNRTWAMAEHWTRWLRRQGPTARACVLESIELVHDSAAINHSALFWSTRPRGGREGTQWPRLPQDAWRFGAPVDGSGPPVGRRPASGSHARQRGASGSHARQRQRRRRSAAAAGTPP